MTKQNKCHIEFKCSNINNECVYYQSLKDCDNCMFFGFVNSSCLSKLAQVNAAVRFIKDSGLDDILNNKGE